MNGDPALQARYEAVLVRISRACEAAGRPANSVRLLAVSKTFGGGDVLALAGLGQRAFGESYLQEALPKLQACTAWQLEWHFIGPIQSNKTRPIAEHFDWVHGVDRDKIAQRLSEQRAPDLAPLQVCVQVNVSGEASKSGCDPAQAQELAHLIASLPRLRLRGVMAIPEPTDDISRQREQFARVRSVFEKIRNAGLEVDTLSMGMSDDLEAAIAEGSTMVRVGTALFGRRDTGQPASTTTGSG